jgi:hypothetical protein
MIRPLRRAHRLVMLLLAAVLPLLLWLAVAQRPLAPMQRPWPIGDRP